MTSLIDAGLLLRPPLFLAWRNFEGMRSYAPVSGGGRTFLFSPEHFCLARETSTGKVDWTYRVPRRNTGPRFIAGAALAVGVVLPRGKDGKRRIDFLDPETGERIRSVDRGERGNMEVVGDLVVAGAMSDLECWAHKTGEGLWSIDFGSELQNWMLDQPFYVDTEVVVIGMQGGRVRCIRTKTAEPVWETSVAEFRIGVHPGTVSGQMERFGRVLVIPVYHHTVGISLDSGERLWSIERRLLHGRPRCGDRLFMELAHGWGWLDPQNGTFHSLPRLESPPGFLRFYGGSWLISSTHYFQTLWGWIDAWDRDTGKLVWSGQATGGEGYLSHSPMTVADGRLYYRDSTYHTYCFEEVEPSDPVLKAERAIGRSNPSPEALASGVMKTTASPLSVTCKKPAKTKMRPLVRTKTSKAVARRVQPSKETMAGREGKR